MSTPFLALDPGDSGLEPGLIDPAWSGRGQYQGDSPPRDDAAAPWARYHLIVTWSRAAAGHVTVGGSPMDRYRPIAEHGLIGDLQTAALVTTDGSIDWFCCPRFD